MHNLTSYGPGKFSFVVDEIANAIVQNGPDDSMGDVSESGFYACIVRGEIKLAPPFADLTPDVLARLSDDDIAFLRQHKAGFILVENSQGFVTVDFYESVAELDERWKELSERLGED